MKKLCLFRAASMALSIASSTLCLAQASSSISQNFDVSCLLSSDFPSGWELYNPLHSTVPSGEWTCAPTGGRAGTPGMQCTGIYSGGYNLDTSYLITPLLNFSSYAPNPVYLHFDTKTTNIHHGSGLSLLRTTASDSTISSHDTDLTTLPLFSNNDSSGWTTHEVNLTPLEGYGDFYLTFRFSSSADSGSTWFIDNIYTSTTSILNVAGINRQTSPLKVIGASTSNQITLSYSLPIAGAYYLSIYDMVGRQAYKETINASDNPNTYTITGLGLHPGMYFIKMYGDESTFGVAKTIVY
jgi:hypothetical protein